MRPADPEKLPRILASATRLFAERGFHAVRMEDIATQAGVAKGTLYLFFKDKERLFRAMVADAMGRGLDEVESRLADVPGARDRLRIVIDESVRFSDLYPHYLEVLHQLDSTPPEKRDADIEAKRARYIGLIVETLRSLEADGVAPIGQPERATLALLGMLHRIMVATPRPWPDDLADWIERQFLYGLAGGPGQC
ncbi:TetR/AcrR family transcriptional regulator [Isosphaeraceae bacterium EP7]